MVSVRWEECLSPLGDDDIVRVEAVLNCKFPKDYLADVRQCQGGYPVPSDFYFTDPDYGPSETTVGELLTFDDASTDNILNVVDDVRERMPEGIVPVADDGAGNLICFDYRSNRDSPSVVLWLHEKLRDRSVVHLAASWTEFMGTLHEPLDEQ